MLGCECEWPAGCRNIGGPRLTPVAVSGLSDAVAITAGGAHACSLHATGTVRCWGDNRFGQLGDDTTVDRVTPVVVGGVSNAVAVDAGETHTCAVLADGTARCWGSNTEGQLGDGTSGNRRTRAVVVSGLSRVTSISAGLLHTCALADGTGRCWGHNPFGALGNGTQGGDASSPLPVIVNGVTNATGISAGHFTSCASLADGTARCWGNNSAGQLGNGVSGGAEPIAVAVTGLTLGVAITTNGSHSCALLAEGSVACWGSNSFGQVGTGSPASTSPFAAIVSGGGGGFSARDVAAGRNHTCAVRANGTVACWGDNDFGQIGDGTFGVDRLVPVTVPGLTHVVALTAGDAHTCALRVTGRVHCWGHNGSGQLGIGTTVNSVSPVMIPTLTSVKAISAGGGIAGSHTCALLANSTLRCWGANANGQIGDGTTQQRLSPVVVFGQTSMVAIAAGELHTCALTSTGGVRCWGSNTNGQLGDDTQIDHIRPDDVKGMVFAVALTTGNLHTCALRANASVWCWGENLLGQLGNSSTTSSAFRVELLSDLVKNRTVAIAGGFGHTCAVTFSGGARCWGDNSVGQLGNATTISSTTPTVVESVRSFITIGLGGTGGAGTIKFPLTNAVTVTAGRRHTCALLSTGAVSCWGENSSGQLGIGTTNNALSPVAVPSFTLNIDTTVLLDDTDGAATVTIVANCDVGETLHFNIALTQGEVSGTRQAAGRCTGELERYPLKVQLRAGDQFVEGAAEVAAVAIIKHGRAVETQDWARRVTIVRAP